MDGGQITMNLYAEHNLEVAAEYQSEGWKHLRLSAEVVGAMSRQFTPKPVAESNPRPFPGHW